MIDYTMHLEKIVELLTTLVALNYIVAFTIIFSIVIVFLYKIIKQFYF